LADSVIQPRYQKDMNLSDCIELAKQAIAAVKRIDLSCGGHTDLLVFRPDGTIDKLQDG
jgi:20S proteasome alpha/beta subunit